MSNNQLLKQSNLVDSVSAEKMLDTWRERIFFAIYTSCLVLVAIPYLVSAAQAMRDQRWLSLVIMTSSILCLIGILALRGYVFRVRAMLGVVVFYILGLNSFLLVGASSSGRIWILAASVIATLLLGLRIGLITLMINALMMLSLGYLSGKGILDLHIAPALPARIWTIVSVTFVFLNAILIMALGVLVRNLEKGLIRTHRLSENLRKANEKHQHFYQLIDNVDSIAVSKDTKLRYLNVNPAYLKLTGHKNLNDIIGKTDAELFQGIATDEQIQEYMENDRRALRLPAGESHTIEERLVGENGEDRYFWTKKFPIYSKDSGTLLGVSTLSTEITQRKRAEKERQRLGAQLQQAQKMEAVGRLAGGVAHDFNNMLSVIIGHTELMLDKMPPESRLRDNIDEISKAAEYSANLTRQLLAFARKQTVAPKDLDLNETVASMLKMLQRLIGEDIDLFWKPGASLDTVRIDPGQVDQLLANLVVNARDAIGQTHGKITIETRNTRFDEQYCADHADFFPGDYVLLAVNDDGCGLDEETRARIFEPFFTTKGIGEGTGLGLATVYGIVKQNNGFINVYSEPEFGTTFNIYLPALMGVSAGSTKSIAGADSPATGDETILVVEDQPALLRMARIMLERLGYTVLVASSPGEALRLAHEQSGRLDLLITDVVMPEMNGRELVDQLQEIYPEVKNLYMSGYTANVIVHQGVLEDGVHFIQKPFSRKDLAKKVREALVSK